MYKLSKDYELLYKLLLEKNNPVCFVDYDIRRNGANIQRDICLLKKDEYRSICFVSRGHEYGGIIYYGIEKNKKTEFELFKEECESLNVEFILPLTGA